METTYFNREVNVPTDFTGIAKFPNGDLMWCQDGVVHREDGPAVIYQDGSKCWLQKGFYHRIDGAAIELSDGRKEYHVLGEKLTEKEFKIFQWMWENTNREQNQKLMEVLVALIKVK